jgi:hypothetical protein
MPRLSSTSTSLPAAPNASQYSRFVSGWLLNNASSYDPQAHGSVVAFPLEYSPKVNQSVEQVDCFAQLSTNVVDLKLFIKYVYVRNLI